MENLQTRIVQVFFLYGNNVYIQRILGFTQDRILGGVQAGADSVGSVDCCAGQVIQAAGNCSSLQLNNFEMMRIFGDILNAGSNILRVFNLNQVVGSKQQNGTAAVGRIVRNTDFRTVSLVPMQ